MRISAIRLSWFRGAAAEDSLDVGSRSIAVYGTNGAGKSTFVDAIEYALNDGRIAHLAHEYSGKHQEKGVVNTHIPKGERTRIAIEFDDDTRLAMEVDLLGSIHASPTSTADISGWNYRRTVLRQDEVSHFIHSTKGEKYSVLLPLLGLGHLEYNATNLRQLRSAIEKSSGIKEASIAAKAAHRRLQQAYVPDREPDSAASGMASLCENHVDAEHVHGTDECSVLLEKAIDRKLDDATSLVRQQMAVERLARVDMSGAIRDVRHATASLAQAANESTQRHIDVVQAALAYLHAKGPALLDACPACGQRVSRDEMAQHLNQELTRLEDARGKLADYNRSVGVARKAAESVIALCSSEEIQGWLQSANDKRLAPIIDSAATISVATDRLGEDQLELFAQTLVPAVVAAASAVGFLQPIAKDLANAKERLLALRGVASADAEGRKAARGEALAKRIAELEAAVREEIHDHTVGIMDEISADIQRMWKVLHPSDPIEDIRLHMPEDADKAIDISLKFYGKDLESPRLTLSEGYRNSLGLCVFLAMATRDNADDLPIILDDVIVSLDRGHRGMVAELLRQEFASRQVLLFTHDRDWYADLRQHLGEKTWTFRALLPYQTPAEGIRWSSRVGTFDDARKFRDVRPDVAANEARKVMDVELSVRAERLGLPLAFAKGDRNDRRTSHEFLEALISQGSKAFRFRDSTTKQLAPNTAAIDLLKVADALLISWANRGSHTEDVTESEADKLIDACEAAISALRCDACKRFVDYAESNNARQCECGALAWK